MMEKNPAVMVLKEPGEINHNYGDGVKTICFELDIFGLPAHFSICVAPKHIRLSDITPLARTLSTKLALIVLDILRSNGDVVPCCKECNNKKKDLTPVEWTEYLSRK